MHLAPPCRDHALLCSAKSHPTAVVPTFLDDVDEDQRVVGAITHRGILGVVVGAAKV